MFVKEVMKRHVKSVGSDATVLEAAQKMAQNNIGCLVVVNDTLEGIITERDILNKVVAPGKSPGQVSVGEVMTRHVITISPDKDMEEASDIMARHRIKRLPVVFGNEVLGIVTSTDVVAVLSKMVKEIYSQQ
jgi:CBS domain-containing protein